MATLSLDLTKKVSDRENDLATKLQVAALTQDADEIAKLRKDPIIKRLFRRGVLKIKSSHFEDLS